MSENNSQTWYHAAFTDLFETRMDNSYLSFFKEHHEKLRFSESKAVLSIGVGTGEIDAYIASRCMPQVRSYIGVEPSPGNCTAFLRNMKKECPQLDVTTFCGRDDQYPGPPNKVDLLLLCSILYHCEDPMETIQHGLQWLKDGGHFVILQGTANHFWLKIKMKNDFTNNSYHFDDVIRDLRRIGLKDGSYYLSPTYTKVYDATDPGNDMCNCLLNKEGSEEEIQGVKAYIRCEQKDGKLEGECQACCVPKYDFGNI